MFRQSELPMTPRPTTPTAQVDALGGAAESARAGPAVVVAADDRAPVRALLAPLHAAIGALLACAACAADVLIRAGSLPLGECRTPAAQKWGR